MENLKRLNLVLDTLNEGLWDWDLKTDDMYWSSSFYTMMGYEIDEFPGTYRFWKELIHPADLVLWESGVQKALKTGESFEVEFRCCRKDGNWQWSLGRGKCVDWTQEGNTTRMVGVNSVISEQRKDKEDLKKSLSLYQDLVDTSQDLVWQCDALGRYIYLNPACKDIFGYEVEEMLGKKFTDFQSSQEAEKDEKEFKRLLQGNATVNYESIHIDKFGNEVHLIFNAKFIKDENGNVVGTRGTAHNITEWKKTEEKYHSLFNNMLDGFALHEVICDETNRIVDYRFLDINPSFSAMTGLKRDIIGKTVLEVLPNIESYWIETYGEVALTGKPVRFENYSKEIDKYFEVYAFCPKLGQFACVFQDVSDRAQITKELTASEKKYRTLVNTLPYGVELIDKEGKILFSNPAHHSIHGYSDGELIGKYIWELVADDGEKEVLKEYYKKLMQERPTPKAYFSKDKTKDGQLIDMQINWDYICNDDGTVQGTICVVSDITKRKQDEKALVEAKEKAEESDHLKTAFLASISHEIRTPMNAILGFAGLLQDSDLTGERRAEYVQMIERGGKRMLSIINDLVDISKIEAKQIQINIKEVSVNTIIDEMFDFFQPEVIAKGLTFTKQKELSLSESIILADKDRIAQVLTNLLVNAIKFTETGEITFGYTRKNDVLEFYVRDTGIGIDFSWQEIIFERFRQVDTDYSKKYEGSGLGLSISKAFVEMHGGRMWVDSVLGKGSTFFFTLPYEPLKIKSVPGENNMDTSFFSKLAKILVVEDDEMSYRLLKEILEKRKFEVVKAQNGKSAVDMVMAQDDIDLILMDVRMPEMDGFEATVQIRKKGRDVPIILQSAFVQGDIEQKALAVGCDGFLTKPIDQAELLSLIHEYINT